MSCLAVRDGSLKILSAVKGKVKTTALLWLQLSQAASLPDSEVHGFRWFPSPAMWLGVGLLHPNLLLPQLPPSLGLERSLNL